MPDPGPPETEERVVASKDAMPARDLRHVVIGAIVLVLAGVAVWRTVLPSSRGSSSGSLPACEAGRVAVSWPKDGRRVGCAEDLGGLIEAASTALRCERPEVPPDVRPGDGIHLTKASDGSCTVAVTSLSGHERLALGIPIDLNAAGIEDLQALRGIGPARAQAIVADRDRNGPFAETTDLRRVRGIGPATVARLTPFVVADAPRDHPGPARDGP